MGIKKDRPTPVYSFQEKRRRKTLRQRKRRGVLKPDENPHEGIEPVPIKVRLPSGTVVNVKRKAMLSNFKWTAEDSEKFLAMIREGTTIKDACANLGVGTGRIRKMRAEDPEFAAMFNAAIEDGNDVIRAAIFERGVEGVTEYVYHEGKVVGKRKVYSDRLLEFLAKSRMRDEFGDKQTIDHSHRFEGAAEQLAAKMANILGLPQPENTPSNPAVIEGSYTVESD